ncbi:hypothetical protein [uncultured Hymenobacter sp.]|uniref:hypothetical protein n=1 Tax=uncultured Hymenobacter sp. TaxID=170016 RepID=UPI0035CB3356
MSLRRAFLAGLGAGAVPPVYVPSLRPPTNGVVRQQLQEFGFTPSPDAPYSGHEYTLDGGATWHSLIWTAVEYDYRNYPATTVGVRAKATEFLPASAVLWAPALLMPVFGENPAGASYSCASDTPLSGWIFSPQYYDRRIWVKVVIDGVDRTKILASGYRQDVRDIVGNNSGYVNYSYTVAHKFRDGRTHTIYFTPDDLIPTGDLKSFSIS